MSETSMEISEQPRVWERAAAEAAAGPFPAVGERALFLGCGTSAFVARSAAALRELRGHGLTDWAYASELPLGRSYDVVVAITRSGTTTEVRDALTHPSVAGARTVCVTGVVDDGVPARCDEVLDLSYADEVSVVQTRFPTTVLAHVRAALGEDLTRAVNDGRLAIEMDLPVDVTGFDQFTFLGRGWTVGLADEAALKIRVVGVREHVRAVHRRRRAVVGGSFAAVLAVGAAGLVLPRLLARSRTSVPSLARRRRRHWSCSMRSMRSGAASKGPRQVAPRPVGGRGRRGCAGRRRRPGSR
jgi:D-arabinose 5-phosphate isomerase GutQ